MSSATIKIFLPHGDPKRLRTAELSNWTGKAVAGPRSEFENVLGREESTSSGVYFLTGTEPDSGKPSVYIGEAECIKDRVKSHLEKDFWNQIVFFISKDENLTKAHIRYLEGQLIELAKKAGRAVVKNGQGSGARLPESDREDMEVFLGKMQQLLPALGVEVLVPATPKNEKDQPRELLTCEIKGLKAMGYLTPNGIVVLKESQAVLGERDSAHKYPWVISLRERLKEEGTLKEKGNFLEFTKDSEFPSPSTAATVIHGGTANGLTVWKTKSGKSLKDLEAV
ncbi:MAG: GIY-YIG nuclease family protein [Candidatus Riflebacteria bacterium]|nr:GIY-YIG nuclease family protein [Candidatus Riflebacteria bacterium]